MLCMIFLKISFIISSNFISATKIRELLRWTLLRYQWLREWHQPLEPLLVVAWVLRGGSPFLSKHSEISKDWIRRYRDRIKKATPTETLIISSRSMCNGPLFECGCSLLELKTTNMVRFNKEDIKAKGVICGGVISSMFPEWVINWWAHSRFF